MYNAIATEPFFVLRLVVSLRLAYDAQGRITSQRRGANARNNWGGEYSYYAKTNKLERVANGMGGSADKRSMGNSGNFVYDSEGNLIEDKSKSLKISYDWRGMPVEFLHETGDNSKDYKLLMAYDGSGRRISKTRYSKNVQYGYWTRDVVTHYTGIGTEVREAMRRSASPKTTVVVNLPEGLGRYMPDDAEKMGGTQIPVDENGNPVYVGEMTPEFEWYLKNHLGSTMLVYGTQPYNDKYSSYADGVKAAYDYRAFGEQVSLAEPTDKVTENFTGKEKDDETELNYFGARYLDPMLGLWISVDPKRQFASPYLYVGNGMNPVNGVDPDGNAAIIEKKGNNVNVTIPVIFSGNAATKQNIEDIKRMVAQQFNGEYGQYNVKTNVVDYNPEIHGHIKNNVSLFNGRSPICGQEGGGSCANIGSLPGIASINALDDHGILHEFGHLMGLDEKYWARYMESKLPYDGYEDNLMGDPSGFDITPGQIEEMWGPGSNRPSNGYESNVIIEYE